MDQPTLTQHPDGTREWRLHGQLHRVDGPAYERPDGILVWYLHGRRHRVDGPAVEHPNGTREWRLHGQRHRVDGPAVERADGYRAWWLHGALLTETEHAQARVLALDTETGWALLRIGTRTRYPYRAGCRTSTKAQAVRHWTDQTTARAGLFLAALAQEK